jgi:O-6-methylguanine DNA methyltransferase
VTLTRHRYDVEGWGAGELWVDDGVVVAHDFAAASAAETTSPHGGASAPRDTIADEQSRGGDGFVADLLQRIHRQLDGAPTSYADVPLELAWCTPFQRDLAHVLQRVPWGEIVSYGELAALAGRPGAARAAGAFCAQNRFWLFLPCHRVVAAAGIGGYGASGVAFKRRLLALEDVTV